MNAPADPTRPLRVGFISAAPLENRNALSGMPHRMSNALRAQGISITHISSTLRPPEHPLNLHLAQRYRLNRRFAIKRFIDSLAPPITRALVLHQIKRHAHFAQKNLDRIADSTQPPLDAIFGCNISKALTAFSTDLPIIYYSDATAPMIIPNYPGIAKRGRCYRQAIIDSERVGVHNTTVALFASPMARDSAVNDLGLDPDRTQVVPMGANVTPDNPDAVIEPAPAPTRDACDLLIVAADPVRKRVDLAIEATELLRARSINATLHIVGKSTQRATTSPVANQLGSLKLSDPNDRATHQRLLRDCHLQLLPSLGEAFGIAPIESAHFARPTIVAGAGGLPFVVQHEQTGLVIDRESGATAWADAVESLIDNPDRYQAMSTNALRRARAELNWDAWGRFVAKVIRDTIATRDS